MAGLSGRNLLLKIAGTDYSANASDVDFEIIPGMADSTTFGASVDSKSNTPTLKDGKFTVKGPLATAMASAILALAGASAVSTFEIGPQGGTVSSGNLKISGNCRLGNCKVATKVDGLIELQAEFKTDGTVTFGAY